MTKDGRMEFCRPLLCNTFVTLHLVSYKTERVCNCVWRIDNMTDKEFKRLNRAQLIEIIYQFQMKVDKLTEQNQELERELADKRLRLSSAGNIAEAALKMNDCFRSAQNAAEQYLNEMKTIREETEAEQHRILSQTQEQRERILSQTQEERQRILAEAQAEAEVIIAGSKKIRADYDCAIEAILKEYQQSPSDDGRWV